jgi:hypothetical protein
MVMPLARARPRQGKISRMVDIDFIPAQSCGMTESEPML